jgi:hypothetical protein
MEKPALIKPLTTTTTTHPADKTEHSSDPSGRRPNQILRIQSESDLLARQQHQSELWAKQRDLNSEEESTEGEEELKISLRVEGYQPTQALPLKSSSDVNGRRSESKENLNPKEQTRKSSGSSSSSGGGKKFRPRNETNEKFLDMEPLPEPPPTPPPPESAGGGASPPPPPRPTSPIPIPTGSGSSRLIGTYCICSLIVCFIYLFDF